MVNEFRFLHCKSIIVICLFFVLFFLNFLNLVEKIVLLLVGAEKKKKKRKNPPLRLDAQHTTKIFLKLANYKYFSLLL